MAQPRMLYEYGRPYTVPDSLEELTGPTTGVVELPLRDYVDVHGVLEAFEPYKLTTDQVDALCARLLAWAEEIESAAR